MIFRNNTFAITSAASSFCIRICTNTLASTFWTTTNLLPKWRIPKIPNFYRFLNFVRQIAKPHWPSVRTKSPVIVFKPSNHFETPKLYAKGKVHHKPYNVSLSKAIPRLFFRRSKISSYLTSLQIFAICYL